MEVLDYQARQRVKYLRKIEVPLVTAAIIKSDVSKAVKRSISDSVPLFILVYC